MFLEEVFDSKPGDVPQPAGTGILPTPAEIVAKLDPAVIGQDRAKRSLACAAYRHVLGQLRASSDVGRPPRGGRILVVGPTGSGKTHLVRLLARILDVAFAYTSATSMTQSGYIGGKLDDVLAAVMTAAGGDIDIAHRGFVFVDEIDKLKRNDHAVGLDVSGLGVQTDLLPFLDGSDITFKRGENPCRFDTRKLLIVAAGAFEGIEHIIERRLQESAGFGFEAWGKLARVSPERLVAEHLTPEDLIQYGMSEEFIGRFDVICTLDRLGPDGLKRILVEAEGSPIAEKQAHFARHGIDLRFDAAAVDALVAKAVAELGGARALPRLVHSALAETEWQLPELAAAGVGAVVVGERLGIDLVVAGHRLAAPPRDERPRARDHLATTPANGATSIQSHPGPSSGEALEETLDDLAGRIKQALSSVGRLSALAMPFAVTAGRLLCEAKERLRREAEQRKPREAEEKKPRTLKSWVEEEFEFSYRTAQVYMRIARASDAGRIDPQQAQHAALPAWPGLGSLRKAQSALSETRGTAEEGRASPAGDRDDRPGDIKADLIAWDKARRLFIAHTKRLVDVRLAGADPATRERFRGKVRDTIATLWNYGRHPREEAGGNPRQIPEPPRGAARE